MDCKKGRLESAEKQWESLKIKYPGGDLFAKWRQEELKQIEQKEKETQKTNVNKK